MVDAVGVVVGEVAVELALEACVAGVEVAGEGGSPAFLEDRLVQRFDVAVGLRAARVDVRDLRAEPLDRGVEALAPEFVAVVGEDALEPPAGGLQLACDTAGEDRGLRGGRVALLPASVPPSGRERIAFGRPLSPSPRRAARDLDADSVWRAAEVSFAPEVRLSADVTRAAVDRDGVRW